MVKNISSEEETVPENNHQPLSDEQTKMIESDTESEVSEMHHPETEEGEKIDETKETQKIEDIDKQESETTNKKAIIELKEVDIYQKKLLILPHISITINKGEFVYLIGKTGTGKSSIFKTLIADEPMHGEYAMIAGYDLKKIRQKDIPFLRRKLGIVFQDYQLLSDKTVIDNLAFMLRASGWKNKDEMMNRAEEVLEIVGLETKDFRYPHQLSGGEQQRVCIARALLNNPDIILADEPTGNLDPITSEEIFQVFHNINQKGTTVCIATHDFLMIDKFPSRTICITDGNLIDSYV